MGYWVADWLKEQDILTDEELSSAIRGDGGLDLAIEMAEARIGTHVKLSSSPGRVVAGRRLDLSGVLSCSGTKCLEHEIDQLFSSFGYYFDRVIVEGLTPGHFLSAVRADADSRRLVRLRLETHAHIYLVLERIGATEYLDFAPKPHTNCGDHYHQHAQELGLSVLVDEELEKKAIDFLVKEGRMTQEQMGDLIAYVFQFPVEEQWVRWRRPSEPPPTIEEVATSWVVSHSLGLIGDFSLAAMCGLPLAAPADQFLDLSASKARPLTPEDVAVSLQLPVLSGLPAADVIRAREEDRDHFLKFRQALTAAIREQLSLGESSAASTAAEKVIREFVEPAIADIDVRLKAASRSFARKSANNVGIASVMTTVGLLGGMPLLVAGGVAAFSGLGMHANQLADQKREVELSDMYFLWNIKKRHGLHT